VRRSNSHFGLYLLLILAMIMWGLSWTNAKILGAYASASVLTFWRFAFSGLSFIPILWFTRQSPRLSLKSSVFVIGGALSITLYNFAYFYGTHIGLATVGGVVVPTMNPLFTFILAILIARRIPLQKEAIGLLLGLVGGALILKVWKFNFDELTTSGNSYFVICSLSWAFLTVITAKAKDYIPLLTFSFWTFSLAALLSFPLTVDSNVIAIFTYDWIFWLNFLLVTFGSMVFATTVYFYGTVILGSERASAFIFTVPLSALIFSMIFLREPLEISTVLGGILAMAAVYMINRTKRILPPT